MLLEKLEYLFRQFLELAEFVPLPIFVFIGSIVEDIIAPIPSPVLHGFIGTIARNRNYTLFMFIILIVLASLGKAIAASFFYYIADKFEDRIPPRIFKIFNIDKEKIEKIGEKLNRGRKDDIIIFLFRAWPLSPSLLVSFTAGFLKINFKTFFVATFLGYLIPTTIYILAGYHGVNFLEEIFMLINI